MRGSTALSELSITYEVSGQQTISLAFRTEPEQKKSQCTNQIEVTTWCYRPPQRVVELQTRW